MSKDIFDDKNFDASSEASSFVIDWGKPGDFIAGTFIKSRHGIETKHGINSIYEILAEKGSYHELEGEGRNAKPVEAVTQINKGDIWGVWGRGEIFNSQMNRLIPGQVVKLLYAEDGQSQKGEFKLIKVYTPKTNEGKALMNQEWLESQEVTAGDM